MDLDYRPSSEVFSPNTLNAENKPVYTYSQATYFQDRIIDIKEDRGNIINNMLSDVFLKHNYIINNQAMSNNMEPIMFDGISSPDNAFFGTTYDSTVDKDYLISLAALYNSGMFLSPINSDKSSM